LLKQSQRLHTQANTQNTTSYAQNVSAVDRVMRLASPTWLDEERSIELGVTPGLITTQTDIL
jgi:hypothetical protein